MGRSSTFVCKTCEKSYYLGYGSYGSWHDGFRTLQEYDSNALTDSTCPSEYLLKKNLNFRKCLSEHEYHDWFTYSEDNSTIRDGSLYCDNPMGNDVLLISDFNKYQHFDLFEVEKEK